MRLLSQSGTKNLRLSNFTTISDQILSVPDITGADLTELRDNGYKVGVIFSVSDIRLQVKLLNSLQKGVVPVINYEDSTATRLSNSVVAKKASERIGLDFTISGKSIGLIELKNYEVTYSLPVLGKFSESGKLLSSEDTLSVEVINIGNGVLKETDYIDVAVDYIYELDGFKVNDELTLRFG